MVFPLYYFPDFELIYLSGGRTFWMFLVFRELRDALDVRRTYVKSKKRIQRTPRIPRMIGSRWAKVLAIRGDAFSMFFYYSRKFIYARK